MQMTGARPQHAGAAGRSARRLGAGRADGPRPRRRPAQGRPLRRAGDARRRRRLGRAGAHDRLAQRGRTRWPASAWPAPRASWWPARRTRWWTPWSGSRPRLDAGVGLLQTNIVYDVDRFAEWFAPGRRGAGLPGRAPVLVGVTPPRSMRMLEYLHERIPGVEVDDATFARMRGPRGRRRQGRGRARSPPTSSRRLRDIAGVAGVHIMAPGWEVEAVPTRHRDGRPAARSAVRHGDREPARCTATALRCLAVLIDGRAYAQELSATLRDELARLPAPRASGRCWWAMTWRRRSISGASIATPARPGSCRGPSACPPMPRSAR